MSDTDDRYDWTSEQKGLVLGAFFYGFCATNILGGYLSDMYSPTIVFGLGEFENLASRRTRVTFRCCRNHDDVNSNPGI